MRLLEVHPIIHEFSTLDEFVAGFDINEQDLIMTIEILYEQSMKHLFKANQVIFFDRYGKEEPTDIMIETILKDVKIHEYQRLIAIGGGACMDVAKILAVAGNKNVDQLFESKDELTKSIELILIPTTCGTGSEVTNIAAINRTRMKTKMGLSSSAMFGDHAILIAEMIAGLPQYVFATSSIDALIHAVESFLSPHATRYSVMFSQLAITELLDGYRKIVYDKVDKQTLSGQFLFASNAAGIAFSIGGCAAVHAMSYQLGGEYHVPHGESNYVMFLEVLRTYERKHSGSKLAALKALVAQQLNCSAESAFSALDELLAKLLPLKRLRDYGVTRDVLPQFAASVVKTQERLTKNNYVPLDYEDYLRMFSQLY